MNLLVLSSCQTALTINNVFTFSFNIGVLTVLLLNLSGPLLMECSSAEWYRMIHRYKKYNCKKILSKARFLAVLILICFRTTNSFRDFWEDSRFNRFKFIVNFLILVSSDALILIRDGWFFITVKSILVKKIPIFLKFDWLKWAPFLDGEFAWS